jgi:HPt (histidine-containing phosphotransfer) domain-containing protein
MNEADCIDETALARLRDLGGEPFLRQMLGLFLDLARKKLEEARAAERAADLEGIRKAIHPLRSSSGNVGAQAMMELATRIDELAGQPSLAPIPALLRELEAAFGWVEARLEQERASLPA